MNLQNEFLRILDVYGHPVLVVRSLKRLRCSCWNDLKQEADRDCPVCYGLGFVPAVEKHITRDVDTSVPETLARLSKDSGFGSMGVSGRQYFFEPSLVLNPGDLIVEVEWLPNGRPKYKGDGIYEISHIDPQKFEGGKLVFNKIYCKDKPVMKYIRGIRIVEEDNIVNYEIAVRGGWKDDAKNE